MTPKQTKTAVLVVMVILVVAAIFVSLVKTSARRQQAKIAASINQINAVNVDLPDPQVQAKTLIFTAMIQKQIPPAATWCDTLNAGKKLWPVTPTNTVFALNSQMAGRAYTAGVRGDTVVFFETTEPGWNRAGGPELLAKKADGVAVAFMDGRAMIVSPAEVAGLRWAP